MSVELKIKSKHLALEPAIIRHEENKLLKQMKWYKQHHQITDTSNHEDYNKMASKHYYLALHRKSDVRNEARATHLARAYLDGKSYASVEKKCLNDRLLWNTIVPRIVSMVMKYGPVYYPKTWDKDQKKSVYNSLDLIKVKDEIMAWIEKKDK